MWTIGAVLILQGFLLLLIHRTAGTLDCLCTTEDCQRTNDILCHTESMCYVQYTPPGSQSEAPILVRGCIDGRTPLLCENQRPEFFDGAWPIMFCCASHLCNKGVLPTLPPWAIGGQENRTKVGQVNPANRLAEPTNKQTPSHDRQPSPRISMNPLYIGVPVAGACTLLAISIFAVYIIRRQNQVYEKQYLRTQVKRRPLPCMQGCHYVTMVTRNGQPLPRCHAGCVYADSDRSSNGSESRLLA